MSVLWPEHWLGTVPNTLAFYIFVIECSFLLVSWPMHFPGSRKLQILRKSFILPDQDESESPAWGGAGAQTDRKLNPDISAQYGT